MKGKPFGLDIGATTIKLVSLGSAGGRHVLEAALTYPAPAKGILSDSPFDQEELVQTIRKIVKDANLSSKTVNIALPESQVYTRVIEMPNLSDKELASAIYWEAEQYIPVPLANLALDWKILKKPQEAETNAKMNVLLVGAPTLLVEKFQSILTMAGLSINVMETEIISAARVLSFSSTVTIPTTMIVHIGAISTSLAIMQAGTLVFAFSVPVGGTAINRAIASDFGFSVSQAEEYKKVYGMSNKTLGGKIGKATEPILLSVLSEVKKAIAFYNTKYKSDSPIQQIILSGGTAKLPGIDIFFAKNCGIESVIANPWKILTTQTVPKEILDSAPHYAIAVGLAMRDYE